MTPPIRCMVDEDLGPDGTCEPPGVPRDDCSAGFEWIDGGCHAILPDGPCPEGTMALPGEIACREVVPCGAPPFGEIPVEANTQFVDQGFAGASDGSASAPWGTIGQGVTAAAPGATVAIAPGHCAERVELSKPVRLWGLCPGAVTVSGAAGEMDAIFVPAAEAGSEIRNLAVTSPGVGIGGARDGAIDSEPDRGKHTSGRLQFCGKHWPRRQHARVQPHPTDGRDLPGHAVDLRRSGRQQLWLPRRVRGVPSGEQGPGATDGPVMPAEDSQVGARPTSVRSWDLSLPRVSAGRAPGERDG